MDVRHQRYPDAFLYVNYSPGGPGVRHGHADDFAAAVLKLPDLRDGRLYVAGIGLGHRLHRDRGAAADGHPADIDGPTGPPLHHGTSDPPLAQRKISW